MIIASNGDFVAYDDDLCITQVPELKHGIDVESVRWALLSNDSGNWFPLTRLSWLVDASLFGIDARGFHATSVLIHALAAGFLALALTRLSGAALPSFFVAAVAAEQRTIQLLRPGPLLRPQQKLAHNFESR